MTPEEFVQEFRELKEYIQNGYFSRDSEISRVERLVEAGLNPKQIALVKAIVSEALTDTLYTVLLGLDGCASIGHNQVLYKLQDEEGNQITGEIESHAWEQFQNKNT
jgi:hypothetical protein